MEEHCLVERSTHLSSKELLTRLDPRWWSPHDILCREVDLRLRIRRIGLSAGEGVVHERKSLNEYADPSAIPY